MENQLRDKEIKLATYQKEVAAKLRVIENQKLELESMRGKIKSLFESTRVSCIETVTSRTVQKEVDKKNEGPKKAILLSPRKMPIKVRNFEFL